MQSLDESFDPGFGWFFFLGGSFIVEDSLLQPEAQRLLTGFYIWGSDPRLLERTEDGFEALSLQILLRGSVGDLWPWNCARRIRKFAHPNPAGSATLALARHGSAVMCTV